LPAILLSMKDRLAALRPRGRAVGRAVGRAMRGAGGDEGAAAVEYGLLVALIAVIAIVAVKLVGTKVSSNFSNVGNSL
jgi:pilus assembly protein Flp/PilA